MPKVLHPAKKVFLIEDVISEYGSG